MSGLDVHLVAPARWREYGRKMYADPVDDPGVTLHVEPILLPYLPAINWYAHFYPRLGRIIKQIKPDIIHLWEEPWSFVALQASLLRGKAALVLEIDQNILKHLPPPFETIRRFTLRRTNLILSRSPSAAAVAGACGYWGPVRPIGYGVDEMTFFPSAAGRRPRLPGEALRIGYVGRIIEQKGLDEALTALTLTRSRVDLALMGEGPYQRRLLARAQELGLQHRVSIKGWGNARDVAGFLRSLDISILLSRSMRNWCEQFGRVIIESQSCGVPVIGSSSGAVVNVIGEGGWIVPERNPRALAQLLDRLCQTPDEIFAKGAAGLENVASRFTYDRTAQLLADAWKEASIVHQKPEGFTGVLQQ
jgi:glycosyltransferase involved in cell wall biosynthesis